MAQTVTSAVTRAAGTAHQHRQARLDDHTERPRHSVGEAAETLGHELDVTSRAQERARAVPPAMSAVAGTAIFSGIALWMWRRRGRGD